MIKTILASFVLVLTLAGCSPEGLYSYSPQYFLAKNVVENRDNFNDYDELVFASEEYLEDLKNYDNILYLIGVLKNYVNDELAFELQEKAYFDYWKWLYSHDDQYVIEHFRYGEMPAF